MLKGEQINERSMHKIKPIKSINSRVKSITPCPSSPVSCSSVSSPCSRLYKSKSLASIHAVGLTQSQSSKKS